jgi:hypothetical protein
MFGLLGKKRKPREFRFKPLYYDPDMEDLRKRVAKLKAERDATEKNPENIKNNIKDMYSRNQSRRQSTPKNNKKFFMSNLRLFLILIILGLLSWKLMQSDFFQKLIENWLNGGHH